MRCVPAVLTLLLLTASAVAEVQMTLPLEGYWRPGRYMPVKVGGHDVTVEIGGEGVVASNVPPRGAQVTAPLLMMSEARSVSWSAGGRSGVIDPPLRQLNYDQRLVGFTTVDLDPVRKIFPGDSIIPIQLSEADPLPGPAVAWETLDAVVLDRALGEAKAAELRACGVAVIVRGGSTEAVPGIVGPRAAAEDLAAFAPVQGWQAELPAVYRRRIVLSAVIFAIIAAAMGLLRFRYSAVALVMVCALATAILWLMWRNRPTVFHRWGEIICRNGGWAQVDEWSYTASAGDSEMMMPWRAVMRPYFESSDDRLAMRPVLMCEEDGTPKGFSLQMCPGQKIGFLRRGFGKDSPLLAPVEPAKTPLEGLARRMYLRPGVTIAGQREGFMLADMREDSEPWPTLILKIDQ